MRRRYRRLLPALTHFFGLRPWELDDLTYSEIDAYIQALPEDKE